MTYTYQDKNYEVIIIKKNNKNTYIRVKEGKIYVTTSYFTSKLNIKILLEQNKKSINKMIDKNNFKEQNKNIFTILGTPYQIKIGNKENINKEEKIITIKSVNNLDKFLKQEASIIFYEHLIEKYKIFEEKIPTPSLKIRKMKSRWGVCNTKTKNITLNLELIYYDIECLDYVIIHELSHLVFPNHSKNFWNLVAKYCPNYKEIRKKMRNTC